MNLDHIEDRKISFSTRLKLIAKRLNEYSETDFKDERHSQVIGDNIKYAALELMELAVESAIIRLGVLNQHTKLVISDQAKKLKALVVHPEGSFLKKVPGGFGLANEAQEAEFDLEEAISIATAKTLQDGMNYEITLLAGSQSRQ